MSDVMSGADWWQASDGRWYPPEQHPEYRQPDPRPAPPAPGNPTSPDSPTSARSRPWRLLAGLAVIALVAVVAAAALTSSDDSDPAAPPSPTSTTAPAAPEEATVSQYASRVAEHQEELLAAIDTASPCADFVGLSTCSIGAAITTSTVDLKSQTLVLQLESANTKTRPNYIGPPPAEIASLVSSTIADLKAASAAAGGCPGRRALCSGKSRG